ncbi:lipid asymmetry maintenance ABC transporter permease subunit MlaE [Fastidiosibacter lacustris]|uniref:lipid asymmetry maintenance ABC transporter permease subunit MlaE n=1 Tax=Fastidiosibacter lacustris TaxID=2056695 RepID=UPI000E35168A|nr:lipid asymmetry maintenance ABC transporter permease subunit MlaE [Fastidiosibacter lacustris]
MLKLIQALGRTSLNITAKIGQSILLTIEIICGRSNIRNIITQTYYVGVSSVLIILVSALFIGFVLGLQGFYTLAKFSAESALGPMVALSIIRELGPVVTALLFAGRAGSALTSEVGLMKATEQLASLNMMGVDPVRFVLTPRFWACVISVPILNLFFCTISIWGGYLIGVKLLGLFSGTFWSNMQASVLFYDDVLNGIAKSIVFGVAIAIVSLYQGYACHANSAGIAKATTKTVVYSSLTVLGLDFLMTVLMFKGV